MGLRHTFETPVVSVGATSILNPFSGSPSSFDETNTDNSAAFAGSSFLSKVETVNSTAENNRTANNSESKQEH